VSPVRADLVAEVIGRRGSAPSGESRPRSSSSAPDAVNKAYERVLKSDVRYRFVIDVDTLR
jgi:hypothetical protein